MQPIELPPALDTPIALYLHIPFCESLCTYCSFHRQLLDEPLAHQYFEALRKQIQWVHDSGWQVGQVYFGGGTPTVLIDELAKTIELTNNLFNHPNTSVETNPNHLSESKIKPLQALGVKRLSVGVQSFDDDLLRRMNRYEKYGSAAEVAQKLGWVNSQFETVNVDMIFNLPGQSLASLKRDIDQLKTLSMKQISWYPLMPSDSTRQLLSDSLGRYERKTEWQGFETINEGLKSSYEPSSAWCFNVNDASRGNNCTDEYIGNYKNYLGLGSGAFSYINQSIYASSFSTEDTITDLQEGRSPIVGYQHFNDLEWMNYQLLLQLFSLKVKPHYSDVQYLQHLWSAELASLKALGAITEQVGYFSVTLKGQYIALTLMREFFIAVNRLRDQCLTLNEGNSLIQVKQVS
jgi:coproporphyrinogen III oxidase-like Fe-S oxidoreductase